MYTKPTVVRHITHFVTARLPWWVGLNAIYAVRVPSQPLDRDGCLENAVRHSSSTRPWRSISGIWYRWCKVSKIWTI